MKFVCEKCKTKYSIADQKVRRKVLKIRCKNCANIIVVRDPAARSEASQASHGGGGGASALDQAFDGAFGGPSGPVRRTASSGGRSLQAVARAPKPQEDDFGEMHTELSPFGDLAAAPSGATPMPASQEDGEEWYLAVEGHQFGPMSFNELAKRVKRGEALGDEAFVWCDGFDDWIEVAKVPELRPYAPPPAPPSRSGLFPTPNLESGVETPRPVAPGAPPPSPPQVERRRAATPVPTPMPATPAPVPVSLAIQSQEAALPMQPEVRAPALESGLRHLPPAYSDRPDATLPPHLVPAPPPRDKVSGWFKLTAIAAMGTLLIGVALLVYFLFFDRPPGRQQVALGTKTQLTKPGGAHPAPVAATPVRPPEEPKTTVVFKKPMEIKRDEDDAPSPKRAAKRSAARATSAGGAAAKAPGKKLSAEQRRLLKAMGGKVGGNVPVAPTAAGSRTRGRSREITGGEIQSLQKRHRSMLKACYTRASKRDNTLNEVKAEVVLTVGTSGTVTAVKVKVPDYSMRLCLERALRRWVFRPLGGSKKADVQFPLFFRAN